MDSRKRILLKLGEMYTYLDQLEDFLPADEEEYLKDFKAKKGTK